MARTGFAVEGNWRTLLTDLGVRPADVMRRAGLPADLLTRGGRLSTAAYYRFWESLSAEIDDPLMPIRIGEVIQADAFSPPLFAAMCSPNLTTALERIAHYKPLICGMKLGVDVGPTTVRLTIQFPDDEMEPPMSFVAVELVFFARLARMGTRAPIKPLRVVTLTPPEPAEAYTAFFGVPVDRGDFHGVVFDRADAERPFMTANASMWNIFEPELRRRLDALTAEASTRDRVRATLLEALPSGRVSMEGVGKQLGMSKRTLQRRLKAEETTFQAILRETRLDLSRHYLTRTQLSAPEIAFLLGFEEPNSFHRAFHAWTGSSPERMRAPGEWRASA